MSSVFSIDDAKLLQKVETDMVKIPSMESRNVKLINCGCHQIVLFEEKWASSRKIAST